MATVKPDRDCTRCSLHETAQTVCLMGRGPIPCDIMIVGEAPGYTEDGVGKPFQGRAGQEVLDPILQENGIRRDSVYITNTVRCRPPNNSTPRKSEIDACSKWMRKEIRIVKPKYVLLLGKTALNVCPSWSSKDKLADVRGKSVEHDGIVYFATYHPAACLAGRDRRGKNLSSFKLDLSSFFRLVRSGKTEPGMDTLNTYIVKSMEDFEHMLDDLSHEEFISFDTETMGLNQWKKGDHVVSAQWGLVDKQWYCPIYADHTQWWETQPFRTTNSRKMAFKLMADVVRDKKVLTQNGKFDALWGWVKYGAKIIPWCDSLPLSVLLDENAPHDLSYMSSKLFGAPNYDITVEQKQGYNITLKRHVKYSCYDVFYTRKVIFKLLKELETDGRLLEYFWEVYMPAYQNTITMQYNGVYVDNDKFSVSAREVFAENIRCLSALGRIRPFIDNKTMNKRRQKELRARKGNRRGMNWGSPKQLREFLFDELGFPILERNKPSKADPEGTPKADESVLKRLAQMPKKKKHRFKVVDYANAEHHNLKVMGPEGKEIVWFKGHIQDIPKLVIDYRKSKKMNEFFRSWIKHQDKKHLMHPNFKIEVVTGRGSCSNPNIQQTPRNPVIRSCISSPYGWTHIAADYSQIELRIAAMMANESTMKAVFQTGGDIHRETAVIVARKLDISSEERKKAKAVNFGFIYGMWWKKFMDYARDKYEVIFTAEEAEEVRTDFFDKYPGLIKWHGRQRRIVKNQGYVRTLMGRKRNLPTVYSSDENEVREAERQAINSPVQGSASELKYAAMNDVSKAFSRKRVRLASDIHDELTMRVRNSYLSNQFLCDLKGMMESPSAVERLGIQFTVPIVVEIKIGPWGIGEKWTPTT